MSPSPDLPDLLAEIADVAGLSAALAISQFRGGGRAHFPTKTSDDHWLPVLVGRAAADKLSEHFRVNHKGGVTVLIPLGPTRLYDVARLRALALVDEGFSTRVTAQKVGVTSRSIENWKASRRREKDKAARRASLVARPQATSGDGPEEGRIIVAGNDLLVQVAEIAGMPVALALSQARGTRTVDFPAQPDADHWLVQAFGRETAEDLCQFFVATYGEDVRFSVPRAEPFLYAVVQRRAAVMRVQGHSAEEVARALSVTPEQVEKWCAAERTKAAERRAGRAAPRSSSDEED